MITDAFGQHLLNLGLAYWFREHFFEGMNTYSGVHVENLTFILFHLKVESFRIFIFRTLCIYIYLVYVFCNFVILTL